MSIETLPPIIDQDDHLLFITTRPSRNIQMPDASHAFAARRMIEHAWAEEHGMDVTRLMANGTDSSASTTCPNMGGIVTDDIKTVDPAPIVPQPM